MTPIVTVAPVFSLPNIAAPPMPDTGQGFSSILKNALQQANQLNAGADNQVGQLMSGGKADMSTVMISMEKADVAFQLAMQVRNKVVNAYQDLEKMQF